SALTLLRSDFETPTQFALEPFLRARPLLFRLNGGILTLADEFWKKNEEKIRSLLQLRWKDQFPSKPQSSMREYFTIARDIPLPIPVNVSQFPKVIQYHEQE